MSEKNGGVRDMSKVSQDAFEVEDLEATLSGSAKNDSMSGCPGNEDDYLDANEAYSLYGKKRDVVPDTLVSMEEFVALSKVVPLFGYVGDEEPISYTRANDYPFNGDILSVAVHGERDGIDYIVELVPEEQAVYVRTLLPDNADLGSMNHDNFVKNLLEIREITGGYIVPNTMGQVVWTTNPVDVQYLSGPENEVDPTVQNGHCANISLERYGREMTEFCFGLAENFVAGDYRESYLEINPGVVGIEGMGKFMSRKFEPELVEDIGGLLSPDAESPATLAVSYVVQSRD